MAWIQSLDWKVLLGGVTGLIGIVATWVFASSQRKIGSLKTELQFNNDSMRKLTKAIELRNQTEAYAQFAKETLNGYTWNEIKDIKQKHGLSSLSDVLRYLDAQKKL